MKILIIEDNPKNMKLTSSILAKTGYEVLEAVEAPSGIDLARTEKPDLVLMDIQLPGMDGMSATKILKQDPTTMAIPIIALTAFAMKGDREKIMAAGCDDYISKPIRYKDFLAKVEEWLNKVN